MNFKKCAVWIVCLGICGWALSSPGAYDPSGRWNGMADDNGTTIRFTMTVEKSQETLSGQIDLPDAGAVFKLEDLTFDGETLSFRFAMDGGTVSCEAKLQEDQSFSGTFRSSDGGGGTFSLKRPE